MCRAAPCRGPALYRVLTDRLRHRGTQPNESLHRQLKAKLSKSGGIRNVARTRRLLHLILLDWNRAR